MTTNVLFGSAACSSLNRSGWSRSPTISSTGTRLCLNPLRAERARVLRGIHAAHHRALLGRRRGHSGRGALDHGLRERLTGDQMLDEQRIPLVVARAEPLARARRDRQEPVWVGLEQLERDRSAHRVADDVRLLDVQVIEQARDVVHHLDAVGAGVVRLAAPPVAAAIHGDDVVVVGEPGADRVPHREVRREAVDQDDRLAGPARDVVDGHAVRIERGVHGLRPRGER